MVFWAPFSNGEMEYVNETWDKFGTLQIRIVECFSGSLKWAHVMNYANPNRPLLHIHVMSSTSAFHYNFWCQLSILIFRSITFYILFVFMIWTLQYHTNWACILRICFPRAKLLHKPTLSAATVFIVEKIGMFKNSGIFISLFPVIIFQ